MNMHHVAQLRYGGIHAHQHTDLLHNVGSMSTKDMAAQDAPGRRLAHQLQHALGLVHGQGLAIGTIEGLAALVSHALRLQLVLRQSHASRFGIGEDGSRDDRKRGEGK